MTVVDRFLRYVKFDTQSDELTNMTPSTPGQMIFAQSLEEELKAMGLTEITLDENGYLMATLPATLIMRRYAILRNMAMLAKSSRNF